MAQVGEANINAGSARTVGRVRVDPGMLRGEAGPFEPRLVMPVSFEMHNRPADQMLALLQLTAILHVGDPANPANQIGSPATISLLNNFPVRSVPEGASTYSIDLRFQLSLAAVHRLELARHTARDGNFELFLRLQGPLAWLRTTRGELSTHPSRGRAGNTVADDPFQMQLGLHSEVSLLWTTAIDNLRVQIDPTVWVKNVLPGFGIDNVRLIEVVLPPGLPDIGNAARVFDDAERAYHERRYADCISKCRGIIRAWNKQLSATSKEHLADLVGNSQRWPADDLRRNLLDAVWQALLEASNVASHPEGQDAAYMPTADDARLQLMMTAIVSEYLHQVLR